MPFSAPCYSAVREAGIKYLSCIEKREGPTLDARKCEHGMQRGGGVVVFVHINESATPGCKCLATLLKGRLPVHVCRVLCCFSVALIYGDLFCLQGFKVLFQRRISFSPTARKIQFLRAVGDVFLTDRTHFWDRTQKLTRHLEVECHTSKTPSNIGCGW